MSRVFCRTNSSPLRNKLRQLQELPSSSHLDHGSTEDADSNCTMFLSSVEARLWFLMQSKLTDPFACRGLKSLSTSNKLGSGAHEMLDSSFDDAGDVTLNGEEATSFDTNSCIMELDEVNHLDLFQEHSLDDSTDEGEDGRRPLLGAFSE